LTAPSLATRAARGVFWTSTPFVLQMLMGVLFYGLLPIDVMGRFEGALIVVMLLALISDLGLGSALIQHREASDAHFSSAFWTSALLGLAITAIVVYTAPEAARLVGGERPEEFARILSVLVLLVPFASVSGLFRARLQRDLRFRAMALAEGISVVAYALTAFALLSFSHFIESVVYSSVVREIALLLALGWTSRWRPRFSFNRAALAEILPFGLHLTGSRCVTYINNNLASLVIFPRLGDAAMGYFRFAHRLTLMPLARISTVVMRVFFPTFSTIQDDDALLRRSYLRTVQTISLFYWPALAAAFVFAADGLALMRELLERDMTPALTPISLLIGAAMLKAVGATVGSIFLAKGKANWALYWSLFSLAVLIPALWWGVSMGVSGVAAVIAASSLLFLILSQALTNRLIGLDFSAYLRSLARPALVTVVLYAILATVRPELADDGLVRCLQAAALTLIATGLCLRLFAWGPCLAVWRSLRGQGEGNA
jgi:teichuronic acid exporter